MLEKRNGERRVYDLEEGKNQKILELTDIHEQFCRCIEEDTEPVVTAKDGVESVKIAVEDPTGKNAGSDWKKYKN